MAIYQTVYGAELAILPKKAGGKVKKVLKATVVLAVFLALVVAASASAGGGGGGLDAWFMVDPGCVVEITPYAAYPGRLGPRTFNRPAYLQADPYVPGGMKYEPARMQLVGDVYYDITLWCEGMEPTSQGTIYVLGRASGHYVFWLPLHNVEPGEYGPFAVYDGIE